MPGNGRPSFRLDRYWSDSKILLASCRRKQQKKDNFVFTSGAKKLRRFFCKNPAYCLQENIGGRQKKMAKVLDKKKYDTDMILPVLQQSENVTFLSVSMLQDGSILKIEADSCQLGTDLLETGHALFIKKEQKKRRPTTLARFGLSEEDIAEHGLEEEDWKKELEKYLKKNPGIIVLYQTLPKVSAVTSLLSSCGFSQELIYTVKKMAEAIGDSYSGKETIKKAKDVFLMSVKRYQRLKEAEKNQQDCILDYAYYFDIHAIIGILCVTSIGKVYYDIVNERWAISKKEQKRTGLRIEQINTAGLQAQLLKKYQAVDMCDLELKLHEKQLERQCRTA